MDVQHQAIINCYPEEAQKALFKLRQCIFHCAKNEALGEVSEEIKWGQLSYRVKGGSPIRLAWSASLPGHLSVFFVCSTKLVATYREIYPDVFDFVGNREIRLPLNLPLPINAINHCILLAMRYHKVKHLPLLGG